MSAKIRASLRRFESGRNTKARILAAATALFAQKGFAATSTNAICRSAGTNMAAVHYYFKSKKDLYCRVISHFGEQSLAKYANILRPPATEAEFRVRFELFLETCAESLIEQPELAHIILRDIELPDSPCRDIFKKTFLLTRLKLEEFLKTAQNKGILRPGLDADMAAYLISAQILSQHRSSKGVLGLLQPGDLAHPAYRQRWIRETLELFLNGILKE